MIRIKKALFQTLEKTLQTDFPGKWEGLGFLMNKLIPFNRHHGLFLSILDNNTAKAELPLSRSNQNHLGSMHACALATVGEYCSGMLLIRNFSPTSCRIIIERLDIQYHQQAKTHVYAHAFLSSETIEQIAKNLNDFGQTSTTLEAQLHNRENNLVAIIKTTWQIKKWSQIKNSPV